MEYVVWKSGGEILWTGCVACECNFAASGKTEAAIQLTLHTLLHERGSLQKFKKVTRSLWERAVHKLGELF